LTPYGATSTRCRAAPPPRPATTGLPPIAPPAPRAPLPPAPSRPTGRVRGTAPAGWVRVGWVQSRCVAAWPGGRSTTPSAAARWARR
jgi:hypothetical protein